MTTTPQSPQRTAARCLSCGMRVAAKSRPEDRAVRCPGCGQEFLVRGTPAAAPAPPPAEPTAIAEAVPLDFAAPMTPAPPPPPAVPERFRILRGVSWALAGLLAVAGGQ